MDEILSRLYDKATAFIPYGWDNELPQRMDENNYASPSTPHVSDIVMMKRYPPA